MVSKLFNLWVAVPVSDHYCFYQLLGPSWAAGDKDQREDRAFWATSSPLTEP